MIDGWPPRKIGICTNGPLPSKGITRRTISREFKRQILLPQRAWLKRALTQHPPFHASRHCEIRQVVEKPRRNHNQNTRWEETPLLSTVEFYECLVDQLANFIKQLIKKGQAVSVLPFVDTFIDLHARCHSEAGLPQQRKFRVE